MFCLLRNYILGTMNLGIYLSFEFILCLCGGMHVQWGSGDDCFSPKYLGPGDKTQAIELGGRHAYLLSHLPGSDLRSFEMNT